MEQNYYHISSSALEQGLIFRDQQEFITGMNDLAICISRYNIDLLCFCLMNNHFHFIAYGRLSECQKFGNEYKRICAIRMRQSGNAIKGMKNVTLQYDHIDSQEYLENAIAYVLRNPLSAKIRLMPYHYPWSSISSYFNAGTRNTGRRLADMSERKRFQILKSRINIPDNFFIDENSMIVPSCYVRNDLVENIFRFPGRLLAALARKIESDIEIKMGIGEHFCVTDTELLEQLPELLKLEFGRTSISQLTIEEKVRLCTLLNRNFCAGAKQISRITRISIEVVEKVI